MSRRLDWRPLDSSGITYGSGRVEVVLGRHGWSYFIVENALVPELTARLVPEDQALLMHRGLLRWDLFAYWPQRETLFGLGDGVALNYVASANNTLWCDRAVCDIEDYVLTWRTTGAQMRETLRKRKELKRT